MLATLKGFLRLFFPPFLFIMGLASTLITAFKEASFGLYLLVFLAPQPNIYYKFHSYPLGKDLIDLLFVSVLLGMIIQKKGFAKTGNSLLITSFIGVTYLSLWNSSIRFSLPLPISHSNNLLYDFKNYAQMIIFYFLILNTCKKPDKQKLLILLITFVTLFIAVRCYRNFTPHAMFSYNRRVGGPFETAGLGANHLGAFYADYLAVFLSLFLFEKDKKKKLLFLATVLFGLHPLFFAYSRGAYLGAFAVLLLYGVLRKRAFLILIFVLCLGWHTLLPQSVVDRIDMTENSNGKLEHSAGGRLDLWKLAYRLFEQNVVFGVGYGGYALTYGGKTMNSSVYGSERLHKRQDVHSFYMRTLCEQGIIGFCLLLAILLRAFQSGWKLYRIGETPFQVGLGLGFLGCALSVVVTNLFGDRWSYYVLGSYFWIFWGLVDRNLLDIKVKEDIGT